MRKRKDVPRMSNGKSDQFPFLIILAFSFFIFYAPSAAQSYNLQLHSVDNKQLLLDQLAAIPGNLNNSSAVYDYIQGIVPALIEKGYLESSVDSLSIKESQYDAFIFLGPQYRWARLDLDSLPQGVMLQAGIKKEEWADRIINSKQVSRLAERLLDWSDNNGYPFARAWLQRLEIDNEGRLSAIMMYDRGAIQKIDSIDIRGDVKVSRGFILNYLDLVQGEPYNEKKLRSISNRLRELPFINSSTTWAFEFSLSSNKLILDIKEKKANQINALVGLLPNNNETGNFLLTVDALFAFQNILGHGESITLSYQNLQYKSPRLKSALIYPYLFNTRFGVDGQFELYKKDTTFRRTSLQLGLRYQMSATDFVRVYYENQSNRLITVDTSFVKLNKRLPDNIDVAANGGGFELSLNRTDYRLNPRKGWEAGMRVSALLRQVRKSDAITALSDGSGFDYNKLYDTLIKRSNQYFVNGNFTWYFPLAKKLVLKTEYDGGYVNGQNLFRNELYQIGGFHLLRGFDEQSIFASQYHIISLETRLLLDQNSYVYLFSDNGYVESNFNGLSRDDIYNGIGAGTTLQTKSGLFSISYAVGRNSNSPFQFRQSRIHFGYVSFF
jgi:outer membrane protein assembly factor BamA